MRPLILALPALLLASPAFAQEGPRIDIDVKDQEIAAVIAAIAKKSGQAITVDYRVDARLTLRARDLHWRDALELCALKTGCRVEKDYRGLVLTQPPKGRFKAGPAPARAILMLFARQRRLNLVLGPGLAEPISVDLEDVRSDEGLASLVRGAGRYRVVKDEALSRVVPDPVPVIGRARIAKRAPGMDLSILPASARQMIDLQAQDEDLKATLARLAKQVDFELSIDPKIEAKLSLRLSQLPWIDALSIIARLCRCSLRLTRTGLAIDASIPLTMTEDAIGAKEALEKIAATAERRLSLPKDLPAGPISLHIREVPWLEAVRGIAACLGDYRVFHDEKEIVVEARPASKKPGPRFTRPPIKAKALAQEFETLLQGLKGLSKAELEKSMKTLAPKLEQRLAATGEEGENLLFEAIQRVRLEGPTVDLLDVCANRAVMKESEALIDRMVRAVEEEPGIDLTPARALAARQIQRLKAWKNRYGEVCAREIKTKLLAISVLQSRLAPLKDLKLEVQGAIAEGIALINGRFYKVGDTVAPELVVESVDEGVVTFRLGDVSFRRRVP